MGLLAVMLLKQPLFWDIATVIAIIIVLVLIVAKGIQTFGQTRFEILAKRITGTFYSESLIPTIVFTIILSLIIYFANSRDFYSMRSDGQVRDPSHIIIPPSDHLIKSGEEYNVQVMVKNPYNWNRDSKKPLIACLIIFTVAPYLTEKG